MIKFYERHQGRSSSQILCKHIWPRINSLKLVTQLLAHIERIVLGLLMLQHTLLSLNKEINAETSIQMQRTRIESDG